jgi:hypothetical protein
MGQKGFFDVERRLEAISAGVSIIEHVAGVDDFEVAEATYRAAIQRWPAARITLRQGIRVVHDTG